MKRHSLWIILGVGLLAVSGTLWLKSRSIGGLHPFISRAEIDDIATMLLTAEYSGSGGPRPRKVTADILGNSPSARLSDLLAHVLAHRPYGDFEVHWWMRELVSFSPFSSRATVRTGILINTVGQPVSGGGECICILSRRNGRWELERRRDLVAW